MQYLKLSRCSPWVTRIGHVKSGSLGSAETQQVTPSTNGKRLPWPWGILLMCSSVYDPGADPDTIAKSGSSAESGGCVVWLFLTMLLFVCRAFLRVASQPGARQL